MDPTAYLANSNDCFNINLVRPGSGEEVFEEPFNPQFTYPIFGEEEAILGYSELQLNLTFRANDMRPSLKIDYEDKKNFGEHKAMDIKGLLADFVPDYIYDENFPNDDTSSDTWRPPGELKHSYTSQGKKFELWVSSLADPKARDLFRRFQLLIPFYIEGGTLQSLDDPDWTMTRWKLFLIYEVSPVDHTNTSPYIFAGFSTSYRLWVFPSYDIVKATNITDVSSNGVTDENAEDAATSWRPPTPSWDNESYNYKSSNFSLTSSPSRERISQFVILPPYQGQAHGTHLYSAMMYIFLSDANVFEVTVEDPNESFDDLRDWCDLLKLREIPEFANLSLPDKVSDEQLGKEAVIPIEFLVDQKLLTKLRHSSRISPRQFSRLTEMQLLSTIPVGNRSKTRIVRKHKSPGENDRRYFLWRLLVKERIYQKNIDQLAQLEIEERREKVDQACDAVQEEYNVLLQEADKRAKWGVVRVGLESQAGKGKGKKRRIVIDDEDDEDEGEQLAGKRPKVSA